MPTPSDPARQSFGSLLSLTARLWRRAVDRQLQPFGLTEATWLPLIRIARTPEAMRQKELAASLSLDSSAVVRLLDSLEDWGLIERRESEHDRRAKAILLTKAGQALVDTVEASAQKVRASALAAISERDLATTMRVLRQIGRALNLSDESER
ncbi:MAG TPA: MarR family transcriptional regulator [Magnetospirillaceae bacterium]|jgi:MarR family transcriptional regulator for hemolysin